MEFTEQEKLIIAELVSKTQVSPLQANAVELIGVLQSIVAKLKTDIPK